MCDALAEVDLSTIIEPENHSMKETFASEFSSVDLHDENKDIEPETSSKLNAHVSSEAVCQLSKGILNLHVGGLKKLSSTLNELNRNQEAVIETLQQENARFVETLKMYNLDDIFCKAKLYSLKLQQIKKDMSAVHDRAQKLKKRAFRLQQQKQKEALNKELQRDQELERDKQLAPKMAAKA